MFAVRKLFGKSTRSARTKSRRARRTVRRPRLFEPLENRALLTVVFDPQFAKETVPGTAPYGVMNSPPVYLIFWGSGWGTGNLPGQSAASTLTADARAVLSSPYLGGLSEYGNVGTPVFGGAWIDANSDPPAGFNVGTSGALAADQGEIANAIVNNPSWSPLTQEPIYVVIPVGGSAGYNGQGTWNLPGTSIPLNINICSVGGASNSTDGSTVWDWFTQAFSHEVAERITDPTDPGGVTVNYPTDPSYPGYITPIYLNVNNSPSGNIVEPGFGDQPYANNGGQIGDGEQEMASQAHYGYRVTGIVDGRATAVKVQSFFSATTLDDRGIAGAFIVPDGNTETIYLDPIWTTGSIPGTSPAINGPYFTGNYNLVIRGDQSSTAANDTITVNAGDSEVDVTLDGQKFLLANFYDGGQIKNIYVQPGIGTNTVNIQRLDADQTLWVEDGAFTPAGGTATDTVTVGNNGDLSGMLGQVIVAKILGTVSTTLNIDDSHDAQRSRTVTMGPSSVVPTAMVNPYAVSFSGLGTVIYGLNDVTAVTVSGGPFGNTFNVNSTPSGTSTTIKTGAAADTVEVAATSGPLQINGLGTNVSVNLGNSTAGVQQINGAVTVTSPAGNPSADLTVDDSADTQAQTAVSLSTSSLAMLAPAAITFGQANLSKLTIDTGTGQSDVGILATNAGYTTYVHGNGPENVTVGGDAAQSIAGDMSLDNASGNLMNVSVSDESDGSPVPGTVDVTKSGITGLAPGAIDYNGLQVGSLTIISSILGTTFDVQSTPQTNADNGLIATTTTLLGLGGDRVTLGDANHTMQGIQGYLYVENLASYTSVTLDDAGDTQQHANVLLTRDTTDSSAVYEDITGLAPAIIELDSLGVSDTTILGGTASGANTYNIYDTLSGSLLLETGAGDTVNLHDTSNNATIDGNGVSNTVNVGDGGQLAGILRAVTIWNEGTGLTTLTVDDTTDPNLQTVTIENNAIYGVNGFNDPVNTGPWLSYSGLASLTFKAGTPAVNGVPTGAGNTFNVTSTANLPQGTTLNTGGGAAAVIVGSDPVNLPASRLDPIQGNVTVNGQGKATLTFNDQGGTPGTAPKGVYNYALAQNSFSRTGMATVAFAGMSTVSLNAANAAGSGFNSLGVSSTAPDTIYNVYAGTGLNEFIVSDINYTLNDIQGPLFLHGTSGALPNDDLVSLYDVDKTNHHTFYVNAGTSSQSGVVQRINPATKKADMAAINYDGLNAYAILYTFGAIGDTINVQSNAPNLFTIIGAGNSETVNVGSTSHTMASIAGDLRIQGVKPTVVLDDSGDASSRTIDMSSDTPYTYLLSGLLPTSSLGWGELWLELDPTAPVTLKTGAVATSPTNDLFHIHDFTKVPALNIDAGNGNNTLVGPDQATTWNISGANSGAVGSVKFSHIQNLAGGSASDTFKFGPNGSLSGAVNGSGGGDWLDYSAYTTRVTVNLATGSATGVGGGISNIQNVVGGKAGGTLTGNGGNILIGGGGSNTLIDAYAGSAAVGRSLLIGGTGSSNLTAGSAGDILIAGTTSFDANHAALQSILAEWQSGDSYLLRFQRLEGLASGGANGTNTLIWGKTVRDNDGNGVLNGGAGLDWFFANLGSAGTVDTVNNLNNPSKEHIDNTQ